ncbi:MAG: MogA/MoaB family molybdenum cofactor biosynthesis protein [Theionarchaea archaeon]|nr:MogA/MoaB family molybdenum cofactor biosynthesis protein [Theionarchaea archaeon]
MEEPPHKRNLPEVTYGVITVSDSCYRGERKDASGEYLMELLSGRKYALVPDTKEEILNAVLHMAEEVDVVVTTGGTGLSPHDVTIEALSPAFEKIIVGFGEIFRMLSYEEVGTACLLSSAIAGVITGSLIFCVPGSLNAAKLGGSLIREEAPHMIKHLRE